MLYFFTVIVLVVWFLYWEVTERAADKEKPSQKSKIMGDAYLQLIIRPLGFLLFIAQFLIPPIIPMSHASAQFGLLLVIVGIGVAIWARVALGNNWTQARHYQIKQGHELVTSGVYHYIRHPIYTGMIVAFVGTELVLGSWLWIIFLLLIIPMYIQARKEEEILLRHFGVKYKQYIRNSHMFIPLVW